MASGIWTATAGAAAQAHTVDVVANNLANSDTLAFKKDVATFKEVLAPLEKTDPAVPDLMTGPSRGPARTRDLYPLDGKDQSFVTVDGTYTNFRPGHLNVTQRPLDVALDGPGFLEVSTPAGVRYTRQGTLKIALDGRLVTSDGHPVLASRGEAAGTQVPDIATRFINLADTGGRVSISPSGEIYSGSDLVARLEISEFRDLNKLRKTGNQLFESKDDTNRMAEAPQRTQLRQGMLETSNVNPVEEMTNLIKANRLFEHDLKALKTYGDLMGREANDIGKL